MAEPERDEPKDRSGLCEATLASGACCRYRAAHQHCGERLCGLHERQRRTVVECAVCLTAVRRRGQTELACGHKFHSKCIRSWFRKRPLTCPMCRATCLEGVRLLGPRLAPRLLGLIRTLPPPPRAFFPAYIIGHLENAQVAEALGLNTEKVELLVDLSCQCFTRDNFFAKVRSLEL